MKPEATGTENSDEVQEEVPDKSGQPQEGGVSDTQSTLFLLDCVKRYWNQYSGSHRSQMFNKIHQDFESCGYNVPVDKLRKKWNNLIVTYKRAKNRIRESGHAKITWEHFEAMDSLLSKKMGLSPPEGTIIKSSLFPIESSSATFQTPESTHGSVPLSSVSLSVASETTQPPTSTSSVFFILPQAHAKTAPVIATPVITTTPPVTTLPQQFPPKKKARKDFTAAAGTFLLNQGDQGERRTKLLETLIETNELRRETDYQIKRRSEQRESRREKREAEMLKTLKELSAKQDRVIELLEQIIQNK
ncbi:uncharacterized protein LOC120537928 [Polypterus senegalus]|uniref:uncharacterized protein LOC120537928 n=1 Tax=Polypterus senegalus TaxID=55291 RepID=UPI0019669933|nr:uncharacterized protein LOC120537928 [Polypterus senegalus]XP_039623144.1 uncharacterized protein LOC120537928 [Polypterus senegalus]XP_039623145.1 uncharacterized protein LOC120537928 [Polypterus senegalus]